MHNELKEYALNGGPIVAVSGLTLFGFPVADMAYLAAFIWTIVQIGLSIYDRVQRYRTKDNGR